MTTKLTILSVFLAITTFTFGQGLIMNPDAYEAIEKYDPSDEMGFASSSQPSRVSYRKYAPSVGYQGNTATCVGWSVAYAQLTTQQNMRMGITNYYQRTARAMDPNFLYAFIKTSNDSWCEKGAFILDAMDVLQNVGCKPNNAQPWFNCNTKIKKDDISLALASPYMISGYDAININIKNVKYFLSKGMLVSAGFSTNKSFQSKQTSSSGKWTLLGKLDENSGHAMCIIGYDDYKYGGSFEVMNSYSNNFGDDGFVWITYSDFIKCASQGWIINIPGFNSKTSCLFGDCSSSYSIYKTNDGSYYEGIVKNELPDIYGTKYYSNGNFYIGGWKNGYENGRGLIYSVEKKNYYMVKMRLGKAISAEAVGFANDKESKVMNDLFSQMNTRIPGDLVDPDSEEYEDFINNYETSEKPLYIGKD